ncbi:hypothetical protein BDV30DRAFT_231161 [Aspergillus minisclerotigenes]|uniref:CHAT domain-containing protein n=1 Tax=Aspergillus minisclerotigenes TaxID=656917 RepID=A0A5N6IML1_9EURO|nr:hypothetical protein BDV30DRAFT_231161 [Aspergillus minisclerotigenes]
MDSTPLTSSPCIQALNLFFKFEQHGDTETLDYAIRIHIKVIQRAEDEYFPFLDLLQNLGTMLFHRHQRCGKDTDLNRAIKVTSIAVNAQPQGIPEHTFEQTGSLEDLNRSIDVLSLAVGHSQEYPDRARAMVNLGMSLGMRFEQTGSRDDLRRSIEVTTSAAKRLPRDHPNRSVTLSNLGMLLDKLYERTGRIEDLSRAIDAATLAVDAASYARLYNVAGQVMNNLGVRLGKRFEKTGAMDDINRAIELINHAVASTPLAAADDRANRLSSLGLWLGKRARRTNSMDDLNRAIGSLESALELTPRKQINRIDRLCNLGNLFGQRFENIGSIEDLDQAIHNLDLALDPITQEHYYWAPLACNLGIWLRRRFAVLGSIDDLDTAVDWSCASAPPTERLKAARSALHFLVEAKKWEEASILSRDMVELLLVVNPRSLQDTDKQYLIGQFFGIPAVAAATALHSGKDPYHALQLLELGRNIIVGLVLEMRSDISELQEQYPDLATEFRALQGILDAPSVPYTQPLQDASAWESDALANIRGLPNFHNFLLPPNADEMMAVADPDPIVIINVSHCRVDAFLLPSVDTADIEDWVGRLRSSTPPPLTLLLEWLWDTPVKNNTWPRVWWIPTSVPSNFPLHAAGYHRKRTGNTVLDRALGYARRKAHRATTASNRAVLAAMHKTPGLYANGNLPFATAEVKIPSLRKQDILANLQQCRIFHFAGHGKSADWQTDPLTNPPFLAYLSACSTGMNQVYELSDEGVHLVSAFQLAGFQHVVGTLVLYETILDEGMTDSAVPRGLHRALRALRDVELQTAHSQRDVVLLDEEDEEQEVTNYHWVPYIHFGI